jgi:protein required for attachment to host cells
MPLAPDDPGRTQENVMLLPHGTIIALVDGSKFELLRNTGTEAEPELSPFAAPALDSSNRSGASHRSVPGNHDETQVSEDAHAIAATEWLNAEVLAHRIDNLVIIASPRTLGEMRQNYHGELEKVLKGELAKDLAGRSGDALIEALRGV